jgi:acyl-CoA thioesterase
LGFDDDTRLEPLGDGRYRGYVSETWWTPRGPLGGYVMAIMMRGLGLAVADESRQPRSLTVHFLRPPRAGEVVVVPALERAGRSISTATVRLEQADELLALGLAAFSGPWPSPVLSEAPIPDVEPAPARGEAAAALPDERRPPFVDRLAMAPRFGPPPFSGGDRAETGGWLGLREQRPIDALTVLVLADAWFPAPWPRLEALAPAPTIELTVYFRSPLPLPDSLLLGRFRTRLVRDGFFDETGELWAPDGTLVAQSRQLALLLGVVP